MALDRCPVLKLGKASECSILLDGSLKAGGQQQQPMLRPSVPEKGHESLYDLSAKAYSDTPW